ncbi:MAG: S-adenosyl-l-methionine hydroxide adenosyltransferase family protein [Candidatus Thorarchaeota archaeon]
MIVLMTDFGESEYVGMMKGLIHTIAPNTPITDLTHTISPQSVREGAWVLMQSYRFFPSDSIFVCVVDPGVGTDRDAVVIDTNNYVFIGPDNGLMYPAALRDGVREIYSLNIDDDASVTFHGRDVFAKAAAQFAKGEPGTSIGPQKAHLDVKLEFHLDGREGEVVRIDRFGNIITNIPPRDTDTLLLRVGSIERRIKHFRTYSDGPDEELFTVTGSSDTLEITAKNARASDSLEACVGDRITLD